MAVTFCCTDTGIGMIEQFLKHAFEPFTQENRGAQTSCSGTGLGLPIVKKLVDRMSGSIQLSSKLGKGTIVTIRIPFQIDHSNRADDSEMDSSISLQGKHILLVEDNDLNKFIGCLLLAALAVRLVALFFFKQNVVLNEVSLVLFIAVFVVAVVVMLAKWWKWRTK